MYFWYMYAYGGLGISDLFFAFDKYADGYKGLSQSQLNELLYTAQTIFFVTLVSMQICNSMCIRTRKVSFFSHTPLFRKSSYNPNAVISIVVTLLIALLIVYIPFIQNTFNTRSIPVQYWFTGYAFGIVLFVLDELRKLVARLCSLKIQRWFCW